MTLAVACVALTAAAIALFAVFVFLGLWTSTYGERCPPVSSVAVAGVALLVVVTALGYVVSWTAKPATCLVEKEGNHGSGK